MAVTYGFYNSVNGDRKYNAEQMAQIFDGIINDGVFSSVGTAFTVSPSSGMVISVGAGRAWFNHTWTYNDAAITLTVSTAPAGTLSRIDAVVIEVDTNNRVNTIKIVAGTQAASPVRPTLVNTGGVYQYALAYITVAAGTTAITSTMIASVVGTDTPFVTGPLETVGVTALYDYWRAEFETWFDHLQDELDSNQAANLQHQIDDLKIDTAIELSPASRTATGLDEGDTVSDAIVELSERTVFNYSSKYVIASTPFICYTSTNTGKTVLFDCLFYTYTNYVNILDETERYCIYQLYVRQSSSNYYSVGVYDKQMHRLLLPTNGSGVSGNYFNGFYCERTNTVVVCNYTESLSCSFTEYGIPSSGYVLTDKVTTYTRNGNYALGISANNQFVALSIYSNYVRAYKSPITSTSVLDGGTATPLDIMSNQSVNKMTASLTGDTIVACYGRPNSFTATTTVSYALYDWYSDTVIATSSGLFPGLNPTYSSVYDIVLLHCTRTHIFAVTYYEPDIQLCAIDVSTGNCTHIASTVPWSNRVSPYRLNKATSASDFCYVKDDILTLFVDYGIMQWNISSMSFVSAISWDSLLARDVYGHIGNFINNSINYINRVYGLASLHVENGYAVVRLGLTEPGWTANSSVSTSTSTYAASIPKTAILNLEDFKLSLLPMPVMDTVVDSSGTMFGLDPYNVRAFELKRYSFVLGESQ